MCATEGRNEIKSKKYEYLNFPAAINTSQDVGNLYSFLPSGKKQHQAVHWASHRSLAARSCSIYSCYQRLQHCEKSR